MNKTYGRWSRAVALGVAAVLVMAACGDDDDDAGGSSATEAPSATAAGTEAPAASGEAGGAGITLAINPWTGSAVNAQVAKIVLESKLNTPTKFVEIDEFATWPGMEDGSIDAVLEVWPSGHAADYETYVTRAVPLLRDRAEVKRIALRGAELLETLAKDPARAAKLRALTAQDK